MVNPDPMIEHERLQATIHLMGAFMAYPVKSYIHSLVMARINEHVSHSDADTCVEAFASSMSLQHTYCIGGIVLEPGH